MVLEAVGALGAGALGSVWGYNRDNFLYDRRMRQQTELTVAEWRAEQASQWREDVRDLTGLTEVKMTSYMMVNVLQLSMCVVLYSEGRLQPGTPHWLLHLYMMTLSAAFMYLLMSVWLAMHANVVVACEKARLLTQFVRLPIPTWRQFELMRTPAAAYERLGTRSFRVPFLDTAGRSDESGADRSATRPSSNNGTGLMGSHENPVDAAFGALPMSANGMPRVEKGPLGHGAVDGFPDTWGLEEGGDEVHELEQRPLHSNRHINLVRRAQTHYQCHDAFARVSMSFGTNQLCIAISYFCMGYVSVGDGAPWPAMIISVCMVFVAVALIQMDISFSKQQQMEASILMVLGPALSSISTVCWCMRRLTFLPEVLLPLAMLSHGLWLLWALRACQVQLLPGGAMLPTKFRLIMYLDVFGWTHHQIQQGKKKQEASKKTDGDYMSMAPSGQNTYAAIGSPERGEGSREGTEEDLPDSPRRAQLEEEIQLTIQSWQPAETLQKVDVYTKQRIERISQRFRVLGVGRPSLQGLESRPFEEERTVGAPIVGDSLELEPSMERDLSRSVSEPERELSVDSMGMVTPASLARPWRMAPLNLSEPATPDARPWVKGHYCTDFGTEITYEYLESPHLTVTQRSMSPEPTGFLRAEERRLRSLSEAEDNLKQLEELEDLRWQVEGLAVAPPEERTKRPLTSDLGNSSTIRKDDNTSEGSSGSLTAREFIRSPADFVKNVRRQSRHRAAMTAPWLFGDMDDVPAISFPHTHVGRKLDCPDEGIFAHGGLAESAHDAGDELDNDEIVVSMAPDRLPWQVFRRTTLVLVFIWLVSPILLYGWYPYGMSMFGPQPPRNFREEEQKDGGQINFAETEDPDGTFSGMVIDNRDMDHDLEPTIDDYERMPTLPGGQLLDVRWPFETSFRPRAIACDNTGKHLVVADDFGVYSGRVEFSPYGVEVVVASPPIYFGATSLDAPQAEAQEARKDVRQLRRPANSFEADLASIGANTLHRPPLPPSFAQMPRCTALEGKELEDVGVVCTSDSNHEYCRVLVLHSNGRHLTECPLYTSWGTRMATDAVPAGLNPSSDRPVVRPLSDWKISGSWMDHDHESVESLAVNPDCEQGTLLQSMAEHAFDPAEVGCVIVGTSSGRVVQLRRHVSKEHELVPEWAMQERRGKVAQGSLQVFPGGFLMMLRSEIGLMQAINPELGSLLGQWRLPDSAEWFSISGGGKTLFMLGRERNPNVAEDNRRVSLWTFPLPPELEELFTVYPDKD